MNNPSKKVSGNCPIHNGTFNVDTSEPLEIQTVVVPENPQTVVVKCICPAENKPQQWEEGFLELWNECFVTGGEPRFSHQKATVMDFIRQLLATAQKEGYEKAAEAHADRWLKGMDEAHENGMSQARLAFADEVVGMREGVIEKNPYEESSPQYFAYNQALDAVLALLGEEKKDL